MAHAQPRESVDLKEVGLFWYPLPDLSLDSDADICQLFEATRHYRFPISRESHGQKFYALAATWRSDTAYLSSITQIAMHPAYQEIIGMGQAAIPLILRELERRAEQWFWALKAISGVDPVPASEQGKVRVMAAAWLRWGKQQSYIS